MKLNQFSGCKMLAVIVIVLVLLIYYQNLFKYFQQRPNKSESVKSLEHKTENEVTTSKRIKRFLIFQGGGVVKLVLGTSFPVIMADKKRSLNYFYNFQMQYAPPTIPLYWWSLFNTTTFVARTKLSKRSMDNSMRYDKSRTFIYEFIETTLTRSGNFGNECLLKIICELGRAPFIEDLSARTEEPAMLNIKYNAENEIVDDYGRSIYHKLINAIFTPLKPNVDGRYLNARIAGQNGANCRETFPLCPITDKWFKRFTQFI